MGDLHTSVVLVLSLITANAVASVTHIHATQEPIRIEVEEGTDIPFNKLSRSNDLSQQRVTHIVQDNQGFLWFGTQYGLNRHDGYRFRVYKHDPNDPGSLCGVYVSTLFKDRSGSLWVGCDYSLDRYDAETESFVHYRIDPDLPLDRASAVIHISQDDADQLWLSTGNGVYRLDPVSGVATRFPARERDPAGTGSDEVKFSGEDRFGNFWIATSGGLEMFDRDAARVALRLSVREPRDMGFYEDSHGVFWVFYGSGNGLSIFDRATGTLTPYAFSPADRTQVGLTGVSSILEDHLGTLWIGTFSDGLLKFDRDRNKFIRYRHDVRNEWSITENRITTLSEDREGNIWVGFGATEPAFFASERRPFSVLPFDAANVSNLGEKLVNAIYVDADGTIWVGTTGALNRIDGTTGALRRHELPGAGLASDVLAIARDRSGRLWIGTSGQGLYRLDEASGLAQGFRHIEGDPESLINDIVVDLLVDHAGKLWVATLDGLNSFDTSSEQFVPYRHVEGGPSLEYTSIAEDTSGRLWLSSNGAGLVRFDPEKNQYEIFGAGNRQSQRLSHLYINSIFIDHAGAVWAGTQNGLNKLDPATGAITAFFEDDGLASNAVSCVQEDAGGVLWIGTSNGLSRLDADRAVFKNYSAADGLPGSDLTGWSACYRGANGKLYFGGFAGAVAFEPGNLTEAEYVPPIVLTGFEVLGVPVTLGPNSIIKRAIGFTSELALSHEEHSFSFEFSALSFSSPETNRYRYKLEGLDSDWQNVDSRRRFASYTTLPPGKYRFTAQGATSRGEWSEPGLALAVTILPPWWRTWLFRGVALMLLGALTWTAYAYRVRQIAQQFDMRLEARVSERTRIARELHDSLLQGFQGMMLRLQAVRNMLPVRPGDAAEALEQVMNRGDDVIAEGREAVLNLRSPEAGERDLVNSLAALKNELQSGMDVPVPSYRVSVEGQPRPIPFQVRDEAYRIAREAFRNAVMHARAEKIEAEIAFSDAGLCVRIRDNGIGIDQHILEQGRRAGHWGLQGMRERAEALHGNLAVWSKHGAGTEVELRVPANVAFGPGTVE